jgi:hypothetical protein
MVGAGWASGGSASMSSRRFVRVPAPELQIAIPAQGSDWRRFRTGVLWLLRRIRAWWLARHLDGDVDLRQGGHE